MNTVAPHSVNLLVTGWQQEDGLVYLKLPQGKYKISERIIMVPNNDEQIIDVSEVDNLYRVIETHCVKHYVNLINGHTMDVEAYTVKLNDLDTRKVYHDEDGLAWPSIQDRHAHELFTSQWKAHYEPISIFQKVEIHLEGQAPVTNNKFIKPIRKLSGDLTNTLYIYSKGEHITSVVEDVFSKHGYRKLDEELPALCNPKDMDKTYHLRYGTVEFARMFPSAASGSKFITIEIPGLKKYEKITGRSTGTLAEIEVEFNRTDEDLRSILGAYFNRAKLLTDVDQPTIGMVLTGLDSLAKLIAKVSSVKKTQVEHSAALKQSQELLKIFQAAASK